MLSQFSIKVFSEDAVYRKTAFLLTNIVLLGTILPSHGQYIYTVKI